MRVPPFQPLPGAGPDPLFGARDEAGVDPGFRRGALKEA